MTNPTSTPQNESAPQIEAKQRRRAPIAKAREIHERWQSIRQQQRDARAYAEAWLQALRAWETRSHAELVPRTTGGGGAGRMVAIVGNYGRGQGRLTMQQVNTPLGWVSEAAVARLCGADPLLERLRCGGGLATLIHASGRGWAGQRAQEYATALLTLAAALGDGRATEAQHLVFAED